MKLLTCWKVSKGILFLFLGSLLMAQEGEIVPLSPKVGLLVDAEENQFYEIFPDIKGFESAQFYELPDQHYVARIIFVEYSRRKLTRRGFTLSQFVALSNRVSKKPFITEQDRLALRENLTYLETNQVMESIPRNQYVTVVHRDGARIGGTLLDYRDRKLIIQTPVSVETIPLWEMRRIAYRTDIHSRSGWKSVIFAFSALAGLALAEGWNVQTRPKIDMVWHNRFVGSVLGLLAGEEVLDTFAILSSPKTSYSLTPEEMKRLLD
ncbi:MAG: hypothetical protein ACE5DP_02470 [Fidelibacterota bacterium]